MLESIQVWVDDIAYRLVGGERLLLRLPPRVGKSHLLSLVREALGSSAVLADGQEFTEGSQAQKKQQIEDDLLEAIGKYGSAQLLFDSYDQALLRSQGARLQTWLAGRLIDSEHSRDIGALFTARCGTEVLRAGAGSPLMSRVTPVDPPVMSARDYLDGDWSTVQDWFGDSSLLAAQAQSAECFAPLPIADRLEQDLSYLRDIQKAAGDALARQRLEPVRDSFLARSATQGLLTNEGTTQLFERLKGYLLAPPDDDPAWPDGWSTSVSKFCWLVAEAKEVTWIDRYMYRDIEPLRKFLQEIVGRTGCKVHLLGGRTVSGRDVSRAELLRLSVLPGVDARYMNPAHFADLHDRHLFTNPGGWVLPQVHVIVGKQAAGSAVAVPSASFGVDYLSIWHQSLIA